MAAGDPVQPFLPAGYRYRWPAPQAHPDPDRFGRRLVQCAGWRCCTAVQCSLGATGGIHSGEDAIKLLLAGTDVVHLCHALLQNGPKHLRKGDCRYHGMDGTSNFEQLSTWAWRMSQISVNDPSVRTSQLYPGARRYRGREGYGADRRARRSSHSPATGSRRSAQRALAYPARAADALQRQNQHPEQLYEHHHAEQHTTYDRRRRDHRDQQVRVQQDDRYEHGQYTTITSVQE